MQPTTLSRTKVKIKTHEQFGLPTLKRAVDEIIEKIDGSDFGIAVVYVHPQVSFYDLRDKLIELGFKFDSHSMSFSY